MIKRHHLRAAVVLAVLGGTLSLAAPGATAGAGRVAPAAQASAVQAFPAPGTSAAMPQTAITLRGVTLSAARSVQVTGSVSGVHAVTSRAQSDGHGVSIQPRAAFAPGERVTVTGVAVAGGVGDTFSFTIAQPATLSAQALIAQTDTGGAVGPATASDAGGQATSSTRSTSSTRAAVGPPYRTRPDLSPPAIHATTPGNGTAPGVLLTTPNLPGHTGAMIMDDNGQPYWYKPAPGSAFTVGDLETATYHGQNVLVWFEGLAPYGPGSYRGAWTMVDSAYHRIATVHATNGMHADIHEIDITSGGRAYLDIYNPVIRDLSAYGGSRTATVLEFVIQEVDIASGDLLFEWHSLDSFPVTDSYEALTNDPVDYMHGNSVAEDTDGNLLVSARHLSTGFKLSRSTGKVLWRLGGKRNQFAFSPAGETGPSYQHHLARVAPGVISFYDNGRGRPSRGVQYQINETTHTAVRIKEQRHNPQLESFSQGSYQQLPNGHALVAWGNTGVVTEYDSTGATRFEANVPNSYRTFRSVWHGHPDSLPAVATEQAAGHDTVYVSWNGATDVARWEVLTGTSRTNLTSTATVARGGFETAIDVPHTAFVEVRARAADNSVLATSAVATVGPWFADQRAKDVDNVYAPFAGNFAGGAGDDIFWYAPGPGRESVWTAASNGTFTSLPTLPPVNGSYKPLVGDFVGDAHDDVIWSTPGSTTAYLWRSDGAGGFTDSRITVPQALVATVLRHRAGKAEVLWYNPGGASDAIIGYRWSSGAAPTSVIRSIHVSGNFRPVVGDFDGNGWVDLVWYAAGSAPDYYWRLFGNAGGASTGQVVSRLGIAGVFSPVVGRFSSNHDSRDDIVWYAPGRARDYVWQGTGGATFVSAAHTNSATGDPISLQGTQDHLYLRTAGTSGTIWVPGAHGDLIRPTGNSAFSSRYQAIAGDFQDLGKTDLFWYGPGPGQERLFSPRLG